MDFELELKTGKGPEAEVKTLLYLIYQDNGEEIVTTNLPELPQAQLTNFEGNRGESEIFYQGKFEAEKLILLGCGKREEIKAKDIPEISGNILSTVNKQECSEITVVFPLNFKIERENLARKLSLGLALADYEFDQFKQSEDAEEENKVELEKITLLLGDNRSHSTVNRGLDRGIKIAEGVSLTRDLGNQPANELYPARLESEARDLENSSRNISLEVYDEKKLEENNFDLIQAVGRGSARESRLLELDYSPDKPKDTVLLAGKGVTFDSGGISIKPSKNMGEMKFDMCGAGVVLGTIAAASQLKLPIRIIGLIPAVENMPDSRSTRPGDIVTGYGEKSVEILNTDAEGRLILADTLSYASENWGEEADILIDYATLTGACVVALGHAAAGLMGNNDQLCEELEAAGEEVNERVWRLPLWDDYSEKLESKNADVKNIGGKAGTPVAGCFLREFVDEDVFERWAHLDIAGTAWGMEKLSYRPEGATGFGVRLTLELLFQRYSL